MNERGLFLNIMRYADFDRMPVLHWGGWPETMERWHAEGLPRDANVHEFLGARPINASVSANIHLFPPFEEKVFEETNEYQVVRQPDGAVCKRWKHRSCIPQFIDFTLKGGEGWDEYKRRLQPDPARIPANVDEQYQKALAAGVPISVGTGSMVGWLRDWMGVENLAYLAYDDRDLLKEMVMTIADLVCWQLDQILPRVNVDMGWGWEDICFRTGPLVSPHIFRDAAVPGYQRIAAKLRQYGIDLYLVDCDGLIDPLIPLWLESGVNVMFPVQIGPWKTDPFELRRRFGKELRIFGGIDKLEIARGPAAIDAEIQRRLPLMCEGGCVPLPDHLVVPETSLEHYRYYLQAIRELRF